MPTTPEQSAGLKEAQRFVDEVTDAYRAQCVKILVYEGRSFEPTINWGRYLSIGATDLARGDVRERIVLPLAWATLGYMPDSPTAAPYRRQWVYDFNRRAVEISVRFLGVTTRQAVETNAARIIKANENVRRRGLQIPQFEVTPCEHLWSHFALPDPAPACESSLPSK
jgi:hypothetical protein